jgi:hypothetical protein
VAAAEATPAAGEGNFAVQLAAPGSEAEAQAMLTRLQAKYASELSGQQLVIQKAELKDRTVYRIRTSKGPRASGVSICEKLKAAGGACFLARD